MDVSFFLTVLKFSIPGNLARPWFSISNSLGEKAYLLGEGCWEPPITSFGIFSSSSWWRGAHKWLGFWLAYIILQESWSAEAKTAFSSSKFSSAESSSIFLKSARCPWLGRFSCCCWFCWMLLATLFSKIFIDWGEEGILSLIFGAELFMLPLSWLWFNTYYGIFWLTLFNDRSAL